MGLDLTVMASHFRDRRGELLPTATLRLERDSALFAQLSADATPCLVRPLPDGLNLTSDVMWERELPEVFGRFPDFAYYDYSKHFPRVLRFLRGDFPPN